MLTLGLLIPKFPVMKLDHHSKTELLPTSELTMTEIVMVNCSQNSNHDFITSITRTNSRTKLARLGHNIQIIPS